MKSKIDYQKDRIQLLMLDMLLARGYLTQREIRLLIINMLTTLDPLTRRDFVETLELPRTTVYDHLHRLEKSGEVTRFTKNNGKRGRPLVFWKIEN